MASRPIRIRVALARGSPVSAYADAASVPYVVVLAESRQAVRANGSPRGGPCLIFTLSGRRGRRGRADACTLEATRPLAASAFAVYGVAEALARCARDYFATR